MADTRASRRAHGPVAVSKLLFGLFIYFTIDFFMHFSERIPGYGVLRPTLLLTLVLAVMLYSQKDRFTDHAEAPAFRALLVLILYVLLSLPLVEWPGSVLRQHIPEFVKAASFFFFAALIIDTEQRLRVFMYVFLTCQLLRVFEPLYLHIAHGYWGGATYIGNGEFTGRLAGAPADVINPNELAFVIATLMPFLYYLMWRDNRKLAKLLFLVFTPTILYALVLTMSRGGLIAMLVVGWFILRDSQHKVVLLLVALGLAVVLWFHMSPIQKERYLSLVSSHTSQSATVSGRFSGMWREFTIGLSRPLFGHGVGTAPEAKWHAIRSDRASHNLYAELFIEIGLIGFFLFFRYLKALYQAFKANREIMRSVQGVDEDDFRARLNKAMIAVFWMYVVYSINYWGLSVYYWYLFGGLTVAFSRIYFSGAVPAGEPVAAGVPVRVRRRHGMKRGMDRLT